MNRTSRITNSSIAQGMSFVPCYGIVILLLIASSLFGQQPVEQLPLGQANADPQSQDQLRLTMQGEIPLTDFIDYVSRRLNIRILYDESIRQKKVNLVAPDPIPVQGLPEILQSVLINEGLVMADTDSQGFKRITTSNHIPRLARPSGSDDDLTTIGAAVPITRVFVLKDSVPSKMVELVKPVLSQDANGVIPLDRSKLLVVTDIVRNVQRVEELIRVLDGAQTQVVVEFVPAKNVVAKDLAERLTEILDARQRALGKTEESIGSLEVSVDERTSSLVLIGTPSEIQQAKDLLKRLDEDIETSERSFPLRYISPETLDETVRAVVESRPKRPPYRSRVEGNMLIVDSTAELLALVDRTRRQMDTREAPSARSPIRFYKIKNVPAQELVETLRGIGGTVTSNARRRSLPRRRRTTNDPAVPGPNVSPLLNPGIAQPVQVPLTPPAFRDESIGTGVTPFNDQTPIVQASPPENEFQRGFPLDLERGESDDSSDSESLVGTAEVTVDIHTNTIIVVAEPEVQRIYASLIEKLDQRRPQVLVEAKIVIIDTSDDYTLGVEISGGDRTGARRLFSFSSYGLSTVDPTNGALSILPGVGFNGTLVDPSTADVVVRALTNHRRARVLSTPRILVNDNAEGQLTSVLEVPFTSVNASQTVATTSFAGFAEAGTTITVTPTISDDNYLQVDYIVTLNSFTGVGTDGVPPPRQTNEVRSRVTVPDGYTVIVGGLTSKNESHEIDSIPWLELIPIVRDLSSLKVDNWNETSLFVFLKPIILREDKFKDLRYLSDVNLRKSESDTNFPENEPLLIN